MEKQALFTTFWHSGYARGLGIWESFLLVAAGVDGLVILELDSGKHIETVALGRTAQEAGFARSVSVYDGRAYVAKGVGGVSGVDLKTGRTTHTFTRFLGGDAYRAIPVGQQTYVANGTQGVSVLDVSTLAAIRSLPTRDPYHYGQAVDLALLWPHLFVANAAGGLVAVRPETAECNFVNIPGLIRAVHCFQDAVFVWSTELGLVRYDPVDTSLRQIIEPRYRYVERISSHKNQLQLACGYDGVLSIDLWRGTAETLTLDDGYAWDVAETEMRYVAAGPKGVLIRSSAPVPPRSETVSRRVVNPHPLAVPLDSVELSVLREALSERLGFRFDKERSAVLAQAIADRISALDLGDVQTYKAYLNEVPEEFEWLVSRWVICAGWLMRDSDLIRSAMSQAIEQQTARGTTDRELRVWCAGCGLGEEAATILIEFEDLLGSEAECSIRVLATDLAKSAVDCACRGVFSETQMQFVPGPCRQAFFIEERNGACLKPEMLHKIKFRTENILHPSALTTNFLPDIVFCRNVLVYLDLESRVRALDILCNLLALGGLLVLDPWTSVPEEVQGLAAVGNHVYQKTDSRTLHTTGRDTVSVCSLS